MEKGGIRLRLKKGRSKAIKNRHPWVFSGALEKIEGAAPQPGDLVEIIDYDGSWLARAYYNPRSQIVARILTWDEGELVRPAFWRRRIEQALLGRTALKLEPRTTAYRLINAESDHLPGLIVDKYERFVVMQCLTLGIDLRKHQITKILEELLEPAAIIERSDVTVRKPDGLRQTVGILMGEQPPEEVIFSENGHNFAANLMSGHKTGFYLDQRDNRAAVCRPIFVSGKRVLNVFAYTGAFAVYAAASGAQLICNVDDSKTVLANARSNMLLNGFDRPQDEYLAGDAFQLLRQFRDSGRQFDIIILDPPKFAHSQCDVQAACRGYKDLNWLALRCLSPGGILATFSCSGRINADLFQKVLFGAALDAGRDVQIIQPLGQSMDHPILLTVPESAYLKGNLCRVY